MHLSKQAGFTLIELMIVVGILGIISAIARPGYNDYIRNANISRVHAQYHEARRLTDTTYVKGQVQLALNNPVSIPTDTAGWIAIYNSSGQIAPGGGNAYISGAANDTTGQIGITASGTFPTDAQVVIDLPAYETLTGASVTIVAASRH